MLMDGTKGRNLSKPWRSYLMLSQCSNSDLLQRSPTFDTRVSRTIYAIEVRTGFGPFGNLIRTFFRPEHIMSSRNSRASPIETLPIESMDRTAREISRSSYKPLGAKPSPLFQCPIEIATAPVSPNYMSLGHPPNADDEDDTACKEFQEQMMRIPAEIVQAIMDLVFEEAFGPRRVFPHKDRPITNIFLALDREFYRSFHQQYWTQNTWVVSKGPLNKTMRFMTEEPYDETTTDFSLQTPNKAALQIRSVELSFSNADTPDLSEWRQLAEQSATLYINPSHFAPFTTGAPHRGQTLQIAERNTARMKRAQCYEDIQHQLIHTWQDKFDRIAMLNLRHLTLDFTEAYDPGGLHLGVYLVRRLIPFAHGIPADFKILAPDGWIERLIRDAFMVLNAR